MEVEHRKKGRRKKPDMIERHDTSPQQQQDSSRKNEVKNIPFNRSFWFMICVHNPNIIARILELACGPK